MITGPELLRERIAATIDKQAIAYAVAHAVDAILKGTESARIDFWINVDLNVHIQNQKVLERHAGINVYVPANFPAIAKTSKVSPPDVSHRIMIPAALDEKTIASAMASVVRALVIAVQAEQDDFWVNVDLNVHVKRGRSHEKKARINVYGDLINPYGTTVVEAIDQNEIPFEVLDSLCEDLEKGQ
jgi:hypothetical protein